MKTLLKILLLEDSADDVWLIKRQMEHSEMECEWHVVSERVEFAKALDVFQPDVVLSDHSLPSFNSIEALEIFKAYHQHKERELRPFILVTGKVPEDFAVQMLTGGVDDFILKDRLKRLPSSIATALEKCRLENERRKYLQQVVMRESLMKQAEHMAGLGSWQADLTTGAFVWSDEMYTIYGYSPNEIVPSYDTFLKMLHPEDRATMEKAVEEVLRNPRFLGPWTREFRIIDAKGKLKYLSGKLEVSRDKAGNPLALMGFNLDITAKKRLENELDHVYRTAMIGRWELDVAGNTLWWSKVTCELHDVPADYVPDVDSAIHFYKEGGSRDSIRRAVESGMLTGKPWDVELKIITALGKERWVRATGEAEMMNGKPVRLYGTFQDIHARKEGEEELKTANAEKAAMLARMEEAFVSLDRGREG